MGRKTTYNDPARQIVQTSEDQHKYDTPTFRRLEVNAQPVNMFITPNYTEQANSLSLALAEAAPSLAIFAHGAAHEAHQDAFQRGQTARLGESDVDPKDSQALSIFSSPSFKKGYMNLAGFQKGQELEGQMLADYETDPSRNAMTTQEWTSQWLKKNVGDVGDSAYAAGLNEKLVPAVKAVWKQGVTDKVADLTADVNQKVTNAFQGTIKNGWTPEAAAQLKLTIQGDGTENNPGIGGMSNSDWDRTIIKQVEQYINAGGDPDKAVQVLKWTKEKRPDGTPGIYYKAGMAKVIDDLEDKAASVFIQKNTLQENLDRIGRSGDQKGEIDGILTMALDKGVGAGFKALDQAVKANPELWSPGLRMATMEKLRRIQSLKKSEDGGEGSSPAYAGLISKAIKGELGSDQIADMVASGQIKPGQAGTLMSYTTRASSMDKAIFKTPAYEQGLMTLKALPERPPQTVPDVDGSIARSMALRKSYAIAAYNEELANNPGANPASIADNIHKSETKFFNENRYTQDPYFKMYVPKYNSYQEFKQALQDNKVKPGVDVNKETQHWIWLQSQGGR